MSYVNDFYGTIREHSNTEDYLTEWELDYIYESEEIDYCICGHEIIEVCVIKNKLNGNTLSIGNCCIKKFGFEVHGWSNSLFDGLKRLKKNHTNSANKSLITFAFEKGYISDWERKFLVDIARKRKLSEKQYLKKIEINKRILECIK